MLTQCPTCGEIPGDFDRYCSTCGTALRSVDEPGDNTATIASIKPVGDTGPVPQVPGAHTGDGSALIIVRGPQTGLHFPLAKASVIVGRAPAADLFLDDITVSRRHVEIQREPDGWHVKDLGSLNGTYLNRQAVESSVLSNGDELQIGKYRLMFHDGSSHPAS